MQIPVDLLHSLEGIKGFNKESFLKVHVSGEQITSVRINPNKWKKRQQVVHPSPSLNKTQEESTSASHNTDHSPANLNLSEAITRKVPWATHGYYLSKRPSFTLDPLFHAGTYYVQEASSMFLEQALRQTTDLSQPLRVLDLCAAPGGKSTLVQSLIAENSLLVSNEVIKSRASVLEENCTKWGAANIIVTNNDPIVFQRLENYFDVIIIDAPCSGSGLFRKDAQAISEWSENNVQLCSQRQQRILADSYPALKKDGILLYSTCSYSEEENEGILDWMLDSFAVSSLQLAMYGEGDNEEWGIIETVSKKHAAFGYRFFPDKIAGEGFFIACFRKLYGDIFNFRQPKKGSLSGFLKMKKPSSCPGLKKRQAYNYGNRAILFLLFLLHWKKTC